MPPNRAQFAWWELGIDEFVKSQKTLVIVIPAKAGMHGNQSLICSRLLRSDGLGDFLRDHQDCLLRKTEPKERGIP